MHQPTARRGHCNSGLWCTSCATCPAKLSGGKGCLAQLPTRNALYGESCSSEGWCGESAGGKHGAALEETCTHQRRGLGRHCLTKHTMDGSTSMTGVEHPECKGRNYRAAHQSSKLRPLAAPWMLQDSACYGTSAAPWCFPGPSGLAARRTFVRPPVISSRYWSTLEACDTL